jgi:hypothetical protein
VSSTGVWPLSSGFRPRGTLNPLSAAAALLAGATSAATLAACGHTARIAPHQQLTVALLEYRLRPARIVAPAGRLGVVVINEGRLVHNLVIARPHPTQTVFAGPSGPRAGTTTLAGRTPDLGPGQSTTLAVNLTPGRYLLSSSVASDALLGEQGTLTVVSK